ncbi:MAG: MoaD/ThiS family protein [Acidimicrobiales bacterium]|nr:MoaD/ThiS family protein [Acidimicrobiales bacterium]HRW39613.1 MoaD/ThiS family protein [Aquihabitans sp.]
MSVTVRVPTTFRTLTGGASEVEVEGSDVGQVLTALDAAHPGFKDRLLDGEGKLHRFVQLYVSDDDIRFREGLDTAVADGETLSIIPAIAGG